MPTHRFALLCCTLLCAAAVQAGTIQFERRAYEVPAGATILTVNVTRTGSTDAAATVVCTARPSGGDADYYGSERVLYFEPGEASRPYPFYAFHYLFEDSADLVLSSPTGADLGTPAVASLKREVVPPKPGRFFISTTTDRDIGYYVYEGSSYPFVEFYVQSDGAGVSVDYTAVDGSAVAGSDFEATHGTTPGNERVWIKILDDAVEEPVETFTIHLSNPVNATVTGGDLTIHVVDNDGVPYVTAGYSWADGRLIRDILAYAGLSRPSTDPITVKAAFSNGKSGTFFFPPGKTFAELYLGTVSPIRGCPTSTTLYYDLSEPSGGNAVIAQPRGRVMIAYPSTQPFPPPFTGPPPTSIVEGNSGETSFRFGPPPSQCYPISTYLWFVEEGSARRGSDFDVQQEGTDLVVRVFGDQRHESNETFAIKLLSSMEPVQFTIIDDDPTATADLTATVSAPPRVVAGSPVTFHITIANAGPDAAESVVVTDTLPPGSVFLAPKASPATCSANGNVVTCGLGTLGKGEFASLDITAQLPAGMLTNSVSVSSAASDPTPAVVATPIEALAALSDIPTVGEWALLALATMLAMVGIARLRL